jgi:hypothetical protein
MSDANLENVAARVRGTRYGKNADRLAADIATGIASQTKLASYRRGIAGGVIAGQSGGTTLDVGNNFAALGSASLQPPQLGMPRPNGALGVRMQGRVEMERRTLPGVVTSSSADGSGFLELTVVIPYAVTPRLGTDSSTGQNVASTEAFDGLLDVSAAAADGTISEALLDDAVTITVPMPEDPDASYAAGQIIDVTTIRQWDNRTIWANREGRRVPVVSRALASESHMTASAPGTAAETPPATSCARYGVDLRLGTSGLPNANGSNSIDYIWDAGSMSYVSETINIVAAGVPDLATPGSYWRIVEYQGGDFDGSSPHYNTATNHYDGLDAYPWCGAGRVGADGSLTGLPTTYSLTGDVPYVKPPGLWPAETDFSVGMRCQTGCDGGDGYIYWHNWYSSHPDGNLQLLAGYYLRSPIADWP